MMKSIDSDIINDFSAEFLEGISDEVLRKNNVGVELNSHQVALLDNLEEPEGENMVSGLMIMPQVQTDVEESVEAEKNIQPSFLENADVRLNDLIAKFMDKASRPVIIICDDKVEYINSVVADILGLPLEEIRGKNFLDFVHPDDWNLLAENIGIMLTDAKSVPVRLQTKNKEMFETVLEALYIPDDNHFAFVLIGNHVRKANNALQQSGNGIEFYDTLTGLPSFYLFEDRVRVAVNREVYKDVSVAKNMVAVAAISIDNIFALQHIGMDEFILKKLASKLVFSLNKSYTVARGIKIQFWVLMTDLADVNILDAELQKIKAIFDEGVDDNLTHHDIRCSIGVSVFPVVARSGKKLLDQTITAVKKAQADDSGICFYSEEN